MFLNPRDSSSTHSLTVRQLNPRRGKNCNAAYQSTFGGIGRTRPPLCISVTLAERVHFSKSTAFAHGGLIVCVSSAPYTRAPACVFANADRAGQERRDGTTIPACTREGSDGDGWPFPGDGNSSSNERHIGFATGSDTRV